MIFLFKRKTVPENSLILKRQAVLGHPTFPVSQCVFPSLRELISHDSCLQLDTRNSFGMSGDIFEDLLAPSEPSAAFFGNLRIMASATCEPTSLIQGDLQSEHMNWRRYPQNFFNSDSETVINLESSFSCRRSLSPKLHG